MNKITVSTIVGSSIEKVWECWSSPEHIINWNFASDDWACPNALNDFRQNGEFNWRMEAKDGSMGFDFTGRYVEIIDHELIRYTMSDGREVTIEFVRDGNEVTVRESFEAEGTNSDEMQRAGWQAILNNFKSYVESN